MNHHEITLEFCRSIGPPRVQRGSVFQQSLLLFLLFFTFTFTHVSSQVPWPLSDPGPAPAGSLVMVDDLQGVHNQPGQLVQVVRRQLVHVHMLPANVLQNLLDKPLCSRNREWRTVITSLLLLSLPVKYSGLIFAVLK